jgi:hypothetical protein
MRARFIFDSLESAAYGLETVLVDARETKSEYLFAGLSASQILKSGLILEGDITEIVEKLKIIDGALEFAE